MAQSFITSPAYTVLPGTVVHKDSVIFSTVFRDCTSCGIILYHLTPEGCDRKEMIPFTDEYRYGSLYSVRIAHLNPSEWAYRYYRDDYSFEDPYARELVTVKTPAGQVTACRLFFQAEDRLPAYSGGFGRAAASWPDEILYCMHVKGFTASASSRCQHRGTFRGIIDRIPYLTKLGITAVELLPVYELRPDALGIEMIGEEQAEGQAERAADSPSFGPKRPGRDPRTGLPLSKPLEGSGPVPARDNYWGFADGCYFAPRRAYAFSADGPQREFAKMVERLHRAGIHVYLQLYFPDTVTIQTQLECARFYVTHYHIDGFHLKGNDAALKTLCSDPMLSDTAIFYYTFPYEDLKKTDTENPASGIPSLEHLCEYRDDDQWTIRRFVKSDDGVLEDFVRAFTYVPRGHGKVHYVTNYEGFTLNDLVSYNTKHNEENGEDNRDGNDNNCSWNCGAEGRSLKKDVRALRMRQMKNFLALNFLAQGTPLLLAGDERCNSQNGNNNPYCQDNETGWVSWKDTGDSKIILKFTQQMIAYRKANGVFRRRAPFRFNDYKVTGYPDISFHGRDAWKPDFSQYSHTVGILYDANYAEEDPQNRLVYVAINMHWKGQLLGIPTPPPKTQWVKVMDTFETESFVAEPEPVPDVKAFYIGERSVCILETRPVPPKRARAVVRMVEEN